MDYIVTHVKCFTYIVKSFRVYEILNLLTDKADGGMRPDRLGFAER